MATEKKIVDDEKGWQHMNMEWRGRKAPTFIFPSILDALNSHDEAKSSSLFKLAFATILIVVFMFFMGIEFSSFGILGTQFLYRDSQLRTMVARQSKVALASGSLVPLEIDDIVVKRDDKLGVDFMFSVTSKEKKEAHPQSAPSDPLSLESRELELEVVGPNSSPLSSTSLKFALQGYSLMLNKYPGIRDHILVVTDEFQEQSGELEAEDLAALYAVVIELPGVGFYNSGATAGASQRHRHLQAVPLDALKSSYGRRAPMDALMLKYRDELLLSGEASRVKEFNFKHALAMLPLVPTPSQLHRIFHKLKKYAECGTECEFNLVMTSKWVLLVPRSTHTATGLTSSIDVNGLAFVGCLLVRSSGELPEPSTVLEAVTSPL